MSEASNVSTGPDTMARRIGFALIHGRKAARWNSGRASTPEDAMKYHAGLVLMITALEGVLDEFLGIEGDDAG